MGRVGIKCKIKPVRNYVPASFDRDLLVLKGKNVKFTGVCLENCVYSHPGRAGFKTGLKTGTGRGEYGHCTCKET